MPPFLATFVFVSLVLILVALPPRATALRRAGRHLAAKPLDCARVVPYQALTCLPRARSRAVIASRPMAPADPGESHAEPDRNGRGSQKYGVHRVDRAPPPSGFVNDAVAERQFPLYIGHPRLPRNPAIGLASDQLPNAPPSADIQIEILWAGGGPRMVP